MWTEKKGRISLEVLPFVLISAQDHLILDLQVSLRK